MVQFFVFLEKSEKNDLGDYFKKALEMGFEPQT